MTILNNFEFAFIFQPTIWIILYKTTVYIRCFILNLNVIACQNVWLLTLQINRLFRSSMAASNFLHVVLSLLMIFNVAAAGAAWSDTENDIESASEYPSITTEQQWQQSAEDSSSSRPGDITDDDDVNLTSGPTILEEKGSALACRCWGASADTGSLIQTECKCHGQHVLSVPLTLPTDLHRL